MAISFVDPSGAHLDPWFSESLCRYPSTVDPFLYLALRFTPGFASFCHDLPMSARPRFRRVSDVNVGRDAKSTLTLPHIAITCRHRQRGHSTSALDAGWVPALCQGYAATFGVLGHVAREVEGGDMDVRKKTIELSAVESLQDSLRSAPARQETSVGYAKAIALMASEIHGLRAKGYGWHDITAMLGERGLRMSTSTLRTYLSRVAGEKRGPSLRRPSGRGGTVQPVSPSPSASRSMEAAKRSARDVPSAVERTSQPPKGRTSEAPSVAPSATSMDRAAPVDNEVPAWSFPVRPDTPDL